MWYGEWLCVMVNGMVLWYCIGEWYGQGKMVWLKGYRYGVSFGKKKNWYGQMDNGILYGKLICPICGVW